MTNQSHQIGISSLLVAFAIAAGAFGAHGLKGIVPANDLQIWHTAVFYHLVVSVVLLCLRPLPSWFFNLVLSGIGIFSGSLYLLVLTDQRWLGAITPIGGVALISAFVIFGLSKLRASKDA
jgi:uncharacterized membrane protein YgdD (TMEM256/DUF423 family)